MFNKLGVWLKLKILKKTCHTHSHTHTPTLFGEVLCGVLILHWENEYAISYFSTCGIFNLKCVCGIMTQFL